MTLTMGKKAQSRKLRRLLAPTPELDALLDGYYEARDVLAEGANVAVFQGQLVTRNTLWEQLFEEAARHGIPEAKVLLNMVPVLD